MLPATLTGATLLTHDLCISNNLLPLFTKVKCFYHKGDEDDSTDIQQSNQSQEGSKIKQDYHNIVEGGSVKHVLKYSTTNSMLTTVIKLVSTYVSNVFEVAVFQFMLIP